jgi:phospholipase C
VANSAQQTIKDRARVSPIGLGYRVPMVIASPWSRGGWVNSQVFDHTSCLQFLEKFLSNKYGKKIEEPNISRWRRTVCGDLTSVFRPYNGEKLNKPAFLDRDEFIESIHKAQFRNVPSNYQRLSKEEIDRINRQPHMSPHMAVQEKGVRTSCALPYELYADGQLRDDRQTLEIAFKAGKGAFGTSSAGSPFTVYAPGIYLQELARSWDFTVAAGDTITYGWPVSNFENETYDLHIYGPNGYFRELAGNPNDPPIKIFCEYEQAKDGTGKLTGNIALRIVRDGNEGLVAVVTDNAYKSGTRSFRIAEASTGIVIETHKSFGWYDFTVQIKGHSSFERRYAGRVETGVASKTDPLMGQVA